jgi:predicted transcriptional regulator
MRKKNNISKEVLEDLYINQKLSSREIAKKLGVSQPTVRSRMKEFGIKSRSISEACKGEKSHNYGKHLPEEVKKKISEAQKGEKSINYGKHHTEEHRRKIGEALKGEKHPMYGKRGEKNHLWKGGIKLVRARNRSKRRQLGFTPLNRPFQGAEAHHLRNKEMVIYIPKELHHRVPHNNWTGENMDIIDNLALDYWKVELLGDIE